MDILQAIKERHSVRRYLDQPIEKGTRKILDNIVREINKESGLHIQVRYDDPKGFDSTLAHYGSFRNVNNYIILAGPKTPDFDERIGYYGEKLVLEAQRLGLHTCWVALTFNKRAVKKLIRDNDKFSMVISLGYGETPGVPHKGKNYLDVIDVADTESVPDWFEEGVEAALLAPTAVNQQKFKIRLRGETPSIQAVGFGSLVKVDLGIVMYHFEAASGKCVFAKEKGQRSF